MMKAMTQPIPKINEINTVGISESKNALVYNNRPLRVQTGLVLCPYGVTDDSKLCFQLSDTATTKLEKIDEMVHSLANEQGMNHIKIITTLTQEKNDSIF